MKNQRRPAPLLLLSSLLYLFAFACSEDEAGRAYTVEKAPGDEVAYGDGATVVIVDGESYVITGEAGDACVQIGEECIDINDARDRCNKEGAQLDIVVVDGEIVQVTCYPPKSEGQLVEEVTVEEDGTTTVPQNLSHTVVVFDESTNGEPIEGDLDFTAENLTIYGNGIDKTLIAGDIRIESNNSVIRSLTVFGNVTYTNNANNSSLSFCKIYGDLTIVANGVTVVSCQVFGNVTVTGTNAKLIGVGVGGEWAVRTSAYCSGCYGFADENEDHVVTEDEVGDPLLCR